MRIAHVLQFLVPGMSYQENILPHEQAKLGHDVWILTSDRLPSPKKSPSGSQNRLARGIYEEDSVRIWRLPSIMPIKSRGQLYLRYLNQALFKIKPDIVNTHGLRFIPTLQILARPPSLVHVGDDHSDNGNLPSGLGNIVRFAVAKWVCKRLHREGGKIFTSNPFAQWLVTEVFAAPPHSVHLLPLGVNTHKFYPEAGKRKEWREKLQLPDDVCAFITSGRLTPGKSFELFFKAFSEVHRRHTASRLVIVGSGLPEYETRLHRLAADLKIENAVIFLKWLSEEDLRACYNAVDVGVMPGKLGGMKEILGVGRPLIAPDHLATSYLVEKGNGLTFASDDSSSLAQAMLRYVESPELRQQHSENSLSVVKGYLSWERLARESLQVYSELISDSSLRNL